MEVIKVCGDPHCEAIFHNVPEREKRCKDCGGRMMKINEMTYKSKYAKNYFQYDWKSMDYFRPLTN